MTTHKHQNTRAQAISIFVLTLKRSKERQAEMRAQ